MLWRTASAPIVATYQNKGNFSVIASQNDEITKSEDERIRQAINLISSKVLSAVSKVYDLSDDPSDYIFPIPRAVTADEPNGNGDRFTHEELTRFSPVHRCQVYATFKNCPLHVEHAADNPKAARGFLPDVQYIVSNPDDQHVICVAAVDTTKDKPFSNGILNSEIDKFSMGCICEAVQCGHPDCGKIAKTDADLCECLRFHRGSEWHGAYVYEDCLGVEFQELSAVGDPADPKAQNQGFVMQRAAHLNQMRQEAKGNFALISQLLNMEDQIEVARYFKANAGILPQSMMNLANKLY